MALDVVVQQQEVEKVIPGREDIEIESFTQIFVVAFVRQCLLDAHAAVSSAMPKIPSYHAIDQRRIRCAFLQQQQPQQMKRNQCIRLSNKLGPGSAVVCWMVHNLSVVGSATLTNCVRPAQ